MTSVFVVAPITYAGAKSNFKAVDDLNEQVIVINADIFFMHYCLALGLSGPDDFDQTLCHSQRNLNQVDHAHAKKIGVAIQNSILKFKEGLIGE